MNIVTVVGNPKPASRTLQAAESLAERLAGHRPTTSIDVATLGPGLLSWGDPGVATALEAVAAAEVLVVGSPTYKAAYTGLLKLFLDQIPSNGLAGVAAVPLMLGAGPGHQLAPELLLKPVLVELGATCPTRALYLLDSDFTSNEVIDPWLDVARPQLEAAIVSAAR